MIAILGIIAALIVIGVIFLFRSMGRVQPPTNQEIMRHNETDAQAKPRPRATGLD